MPCRIPALPNSKILSSTFTVRGKFSDQADQKWKRKFFFVLQSNDLQGNSVRLGNKDNFQPSVVKLGSTITILGKQVSVQLPKNNSLVSNRENFQLMQQQSDSMLTTESPALNNVQKSADSQLIASAQGDKENWTTQQIKLLIERRLTMNEKFKDPRCKKIKYWKEIQEEFLKQGYQFTADSLAAKWKNLLVTYHRNVDKLKKTGESAITWEWFSAIQAVFGSKNSVNPPTDHLKSTLEDHGNDNSGKSSAASSDNIDTSIEETSGSESKNWSVLLRKPPMKARKRHHQKADFYDLLESKRNEELEFKKQRWEEKKEIAKKKIEAIQKLTEALAKNI